MLLTWTATKRLLLLAGMARASPAVSIDQLPKPPAYGQAGAVQTGADDLHSSQPSGSKSEWTTRLRCKHRIGETSEDSRAASGRRTQ
jgi:hypothetical protein